MLSDQTAVLTEASPRDFAAGILEALNNTARAAELGRHARELAETKYSYEAYLDRTRQACDRLKTPPPPVAVVKDLA